MSVAKSLSQLTRAGRTGGLAGHLCRTCLYRSFSTTPFRFQQADKVSQAVGQAAPPPAEGATTKTVPTPGYTPTQRFSPTSTPTPESAGLGVDPDDKDFVPRQLGRPIGMVEDPLVELRSSAAAAGSKGKRFLDYDANMARRKELTRELSRPYFRDFSNLKYHQGKTFLANPKIFKSAAALYFPNLRGITLANPSTAQDVVVRLRGKISVVTVASNLWAKEQVDTFVNAAEVKALISAHSSDGDGDLVQRVEITVEPSRLRFWLQRAFFGRLRRDRPAKWHDNYFIVTDPPSHLVKESIGLMNAKVGYVYLVDEEGKIRWAGSATAEPDEVEFLVAGLGRLIQNLQAGRSESDGSSPVSGGSVG